MVNFRRRCALETPLPRLEVCGVVTSVVTNISDLSPQFVRYWEDSWKEEESRFLPIATKDVRNELLTYSTTCAKPMRLFASPRSASYTTLEIEISKLGVQYGIITILAAHNEVINKHFLRKMLSI